ncbi:hypothetical protein [Xanthomonas arboricola]|uniref:hypothetical protein n=1 Tax=Xanthomonas arboricola TaxID=56448 RepID=UPI0015E44494|nr:hypothetical protein [Xanthomonas arboricola]
MNKNGQIQLALPCLTLIDVCYRIVTQVHVCKVDLRRWAEAIAHADTKRFRRPSKQAGVVDGIVGVRPPHAICSSIPGKEAALHPDTSNIGV